MIVITPARLPLTSVDMKERADQVILVHESSNEWSIYLTTKGQPAFYGMAKAPDQYELRDTLRSAGFPYDIRWAVQI